MRIAELLQEPGEFPTQEPSLGAQLRQAHPTVHVDFEQDRPT
jgi:hypothetical protein